MSYFHISTANDSVTISDVNGKVGVERKAETIPPSILLHVTKALGTVNLSKPNWTKIPLEMSPSSDFSLWFLYELETDRKEESEAFLSSEDLFWSHGVDDDDFFPTKIMDRIYG